MPERSKEITETGEKAAVPPRATAVLLRLFVEKESLDARELFNRGKYASRAVEIGSLATALLT